jgi:hypothetical protein
MGRTKARFRSTSLPVLSLPSTPTPIKLGENAPAAGSSSASVLGPEVVPTAIGGDERVSLFWPPTASLVWANRAVNLENRVDHRPGGLNRVLAGKERALARHGAAWEASAGGFLSPVLIDQIELSLVADELPPGALDAGGECDGRAG